MNEDAEKTNTKWRKFIGNETIFTKNLLGFILYFGFGSAFFKVVFAELLLFPIQIVQTFSGLFLLLTSYPLFVRHIPNRRTKDKKPIKFSVWVLISILLSAFQFIISTFLFS